MLDEKKESKLPGVSSRPIRPWSTLDVHAGIILLRQPSIGEELANNTSVDVGEEQCA